MKKEMLYFSHVATGYGEKEVIKDVNMTVKEGDFVALIGSNGTGKSTLIKCVSGLLPLKRGEINICGKPLSSMSSKERARLVAVVPQSYYVEYDFKVEDIVMMGRNPYLGFRERESKKDYDIVKQAMALTNTEIFRGRSYNALSGGEKQRVILARAIAQQPQIILLDEPTSALDLHHQIEVMELIAKLNREDNITIMAVLHDINLASRFCHRVVMLQEGVVVADGTPTEVIDKQNMQTLYNMKLLLRENSLFDKPEILPIRVLEGKGVKNPLHIHVICGASGAVKIIEELDNIGHRVSAGVLNQGSDDCEICDYLELDNVQIPAFTSVSDEAQKKNLKMMEDADIVLVGNIPFGNDNIKNLSGLENVKGEIYFHKNALSSDFTHGALVKRLEEIGERKKVHYFGDYMEFLDRIKKR